MLVENGLHDLSGVPKPATEAGSEQAAFPEARTRLAPAKWRSFWWLLIVGLVTTALCLPFFRAVFFMGDEGVLLHGAERMLRGDRLYVDFFEFLPPGSFLLTEIWLRLAGISFVSARMLVVLTIVGIACFTFLACHQVSKNALLSALLIMGWLIMSQGFWTQVSHHWFTTLFSMIAAWGALASVDAPQRQLRWPLIAGAAAGTAVMVTPHSGALVMLAGVTTFLNLRRHRPELITYVLASALLPAALLAYVAEQHAFVAAFDDVIRFPVEHYASVNRVPFGFETSAQNFPLKFLFLFGALLTLIVGAGDWRGCVRDRRLHLCAAFGVAAFLGCFPRPDIVRISFVAPLACPLLAYTITKLSEKWLLVAAMIGICGIPALAFSLSIRETMNRDAVVTPRGSVVFMTQPGAPKLLAQIADTPSGDAYFFYPSMPMLQFLTAREDVSKYDVFMAGYTTPSQYQAACLSVMREASWVVIDRLWTDPDFLKYYFPAMLDPRPPETRRFEHALETGFELVAQEGTFELRRRRDGVNEALCTGILALLWQIFRRDMSAAMRALQRRWLCDCNEDRLSDRRQARLRRWAQDSFPPL
jgi:hypothetical protein